MIQSQRSSYRHSDLEALLAPRSVAVVGASEKPGSFGGAVLRNLRTVTGVEVTPVNPSAESVLGVPAVPSLSAIGHPVDLVAVCVPASRVPAVLEEAVETGARSAIVYASGFGEAGGEDAAAYQAAVERAVAAGLRVLGPNCLGFADFGAGLDLTFLTDTMPSVTAGSIALITQSGALGYLIAQAQSRGIGFSSWVSSGNSSDVDSIDLAHYYLEEPTTDVVVLAFEGTASGARIFELGAASRRAGKPVIIHKLGRSEAGAQSARSHTGTFTGSAEVYSAAFRRSGLVEVRHFDELLDVARTFAAFGEPRGTGVGVLTSSGGAAIVAADEAEDAGVALPPLDDATATDFARILPGFGVVGNPADLTAEAVKDPQMYRDAVTVFASSADFGATLIPLTVASRGVTDVRAAAILALAEENPAAHLGVVWMSEWADGPGVVELESSRKVPVYRSWQSAMRAFKLWHSWKPAEISVAGTADVAQDAEEARCLIDQVLASVPGDAVTLTEPEGKAFFEAIGVRSTRPVIFNHAVDVVANADSLRFPSVAKIVSRKILHKWRAGGVRLNLLSVDDVQRAVKELGERFETDGAKCPVLVEPMVSAGNEWFVGMRRDAIFGPVVMCARGGTDVESGKPLLFVGDYSKDELVHAVAGFDFGPGGPAPAELAKVVALVAHACRQIRAIDEIDINPLIEVGDGLVAVDSVVITRRS